MHDVKNRNNKQTKTYEETSLNSKFTDLIMMIIVQIFLTQNALFDF
jgi:hypothetical protein